MLTTRKNLLITALMATFQLLILPTAQKHYCLDIETDLANSGWHAWGQNYTGYYADSFPSEYLGYSMHANGIFVLQVNQSWNEAGFFREFEGNASYEYVYLRYHANAESSTNGVVFVQPATEVAEGILALSPDLTWNETCVRLNAEASTMVRFVSLRSNVTLPTILSTSYFLMDKIIYVTLDEEYSCNSTHFEDIKQLCNSTAATTNPPNSTSQYTTLEYTSTSLPVPTTPVKDDKATSHYVYFITTYAVVLTILIIIFVFRNFIKSIPSKLKQWFRKLEPSS